MINTNKIVIFSFYLFLGKTSKLRFLGKLKMTKQTIKEIIPQKKYLFFFFIISILTALFLTNYDILNLSNKININTIIENHEYFDIKTNMIESKNITFYEKAGYYYNSADYKETGEITYEIDYTKDLLNKDYLFSIYIEGEISKEGTFEIYASKDRNTFKLIDSITEVGRQRKIIEFKDDTLENYKFIKIELKHGLGWTNLYSIRGYYRNNYKYFKKSENINYINKTGFTNYGATNEDGYVYYKLDNKNLEVLELFLNISCPDDTFEVEYSFDNNVFNKLEYTYYIRNATKIFKYYLKISDIKNTTDNLYLRIKLFAKDNVWCNCNDLKISSVTLNDINYFTYILSFLIYLLISIIFISVFYIIHSISISFIFKIPLFETNKISIYLCTSILSLYILSIYNIFNSSNIYLDIHITKYFYYQFTFVFSIIYIILINILLLKKIKTNKHPYRIVSFLFIIVFIFGIMFFYNFSIQGDGGLYYSPLRSIIFDKDLNLDNESEYYKSHVVGITPVLYPNRLGTSFLWGIAYVPAHYLQKITNFLHISNLNINGWNDVYQKSATFFSIIMAFIALLLNFRILNRFFNLRISYLSSIIGFSATTIFTFTFLQPSYSHAADFFVVSLFLFFFVKTFDKKSNLNYLILGLSLFLIGITREQSLFLGLMMFGDFIYRIIKQYKNSKINFKFIKELLINYLFFTIGFFGYFIILFISHSTTNHVSNHIDFIGFFDLSRIKYIFFSTQVGLFTITPIMILSFIGLIFFIFKKKSQDSTMLIIMLSIIFALEFYVLSHVTTINLLKCTLGSRFFINMTIIFIFGIAILLNSTKNSFIFKILITFAILAIIYHLSLNILYEATEVVKSCSYDVDYSVIINTIIDKTFYQCLRL